MKNLQDWLKLETVDEIIKYNQLRLLVKSEKKLEIQQLIKNMSLELFTRIIANQPDIARYFKEKTDISYQHFLEEILASSQSDFVPQFYPPLTDYEYIHGLSFYYYATLDDKVPKFSAERLAYLEKSADLNCYHAIRDLIKYYMEILLNKELKNEQKQTGVAKLVMLAEKAITYHWSPGFLLKGLAYWALGIFNSDKIALEKSLASFLVAKNLAEDKEKYPESQIAINQTGLGISFFDILTKMPLFESCKDGEAIIAKIVANFGEFNQSNITSAYSQKNQILNQFENRLSTQPLSNSNNRF